MLHGSINSLKGLFRNKRKKLTVYLSSYSLFLFLSNYVPAAGISLGKKSQGHEEAEEANSEDACPATSKDPKNVKKFVMDLYDEAKHLCCGCNPGFMLTALCEKGKPHTTKCEPCKSGTFIEEYAHGKRTCIKDNRTCPYDQYYVPSTLATNSQCVCKVGFKEKNEVVCRPHRKCPPGSGVYILGNEYRDTQCKLCLHGFESPKYSSSQRCKIAESVRRHIKNQAVHSNNRTSSSSNNSFHLTDNGSMEADPRLLYAKPTSFDKTSHEPKQSTTADTVEEEKPRERVLTIVFTITGTLTNGVPIIAVVVLIYYSTQKRKKIAKASGITLKIHSRQNNRDDRDEAALLPTNASQTDVYAVSNENTNEEDFNHDVTSIEPTKTLNYPENISEQFSQPSTSRCLKHCHSGVSNVSQKSQPQSASSKKRYTKGNNDFAFKKEDARAAAVLPSLPDKCLSSETSLTRLSTSLVDDGEAKHDLKTTPYPSIPSTLHDPAGIVRTTPVPSTPMQRKYKNSEMYSVGIKLSKMMKRDQMKKFLRDLRSHPSTEQIIDDLERKHSSTSDMVVEAFIKLMEKGFDSFNPDIIKSYFIKEENLQFADLIDECINPKTWNGDVANVC